MLTRLLTTFLLLSAVCAAPAFCDDKPGEHAQLQSCDDFNACTVNDCQPLAFEAHLVALDLQLAAGDIHLVALTTAQAQLVALHADVLQLVRVYIKPPLIELPQCPDDARFSQAHWQFIQYSAVMKARNASGRFTNADC